MCKNKGKTLKIYRIEDSNGYGPYRGSDESYNLIKHHENTSSKRPTFGDDYRLTVNKSSVDEIGISLTDLIERMDDYVFGFSSITQLRNWFNDTDILRLSEVGFDVVEYDLNVEDKLDVIQLTKQIIFRNDLEHKSHKKLFVIKDLVENIDMFTSMKSINITNRSIYGSKFRNIMNGGLLFG